MYISKTLLLLQSPCLHLLFPWLIFLSSRIGICLVPNWGRFVEFWVFIFLTLFSCSVIDPWSSVYIRIFFFLFVFWERTTAPDVLLLISFRFFISIVGRPLVFSGQISSGFELASKPLFSRKVYKNFLFGNYSLHPKTRSSFCAAWINFIETTMTSSIYHVSNTPLLFFSFPLWKTCSSHCSISTGLVGV